METLGKTWMKQFQHQQAQQSNPIPTPTPLSTKTGLNKNKTTALQQTLLNTISNPSGMMNQMGAMQNVNR